METIKLGSSDLTVSRIGLGCEPMGGSDWGVVDPDLAAHAVTESLGFDINLFDTADIYGLGRSEELLSAALGRYRNHAVIISKFGIRWEPGPGQKRARTFRDTSARWAIEAVEHSLRRLKLECIPLYLVHWPDPHSPIAETIEALDRCRRTGKILHIGVSNFSPEQIREAQRTAPLTVVEVQYNLLDRHAEVEILPLCRELGIGVIAYGALAQGLLTGKYGANHRFGTDDRRHRLNHFRPANMAENLKIVKCLREIGVRHGKSPAQVALRWVLDHPAVSCAVVGARSPQQVTENVQAVGWTLDPVERTYLSNGGKPDEQRV
jgi:aryl-alcohol dehydrogenase-like predicted oxidoreductase